MHRCVQMVPNHPAGLVASASCRYWPSWAMLVLLFLAGWHFGGGGVTGVLVGLLLVGAAGGVWAVWMAPTSSRRLPDPGRLILQVALFVSVGAVVVVAGRALLGAAFAVVASGLFALSRRFA